MNVDGQSLEGPRGVRRDELSKAMQLVNHVFASGDEEDMYLRFPVLFADENLENCRVLFDRGRPGSHAAYIVRDAVVGGPTLSLALLGSVCTHEDYREHRLASTVLDDCERRMRSQGVDAVIISGALGLYLRRGARTVSEQYRFTITSMAAAAFTDASLEIRPGSTEDAAVMAALYDSEPVRFVRSRTDWEKLLGKERHASCPSRPHIGYVRRKPVAYVVAENREECQTPASHVDEWAGDTADLMKTVAAVSRLPGRDPIEMAVDREADAALVRTLTEAGIARAPADFGRTVKVLRPAAMFDKLRPYLTLPARDIKVAEVGEGAKLGLDGDVLTLAVEELSRAFFGDPEGVLTDKFEAAGKVGRAMRQNFPAPLPRYGYNFT